MTPISLFWYIQNSNTMKRNNSMASGAKECLVLMTMWRWASQGRSKSFCMATGCADHTDFLVLVSMKHIFLQVIVNNNNTGNIKQFWS